MASHSPNAWRLTLLMLATAFFVIGVQDAASAEWVPTILKMACVRARDIWEYGQRAIYIFGGIGITVCAVFAFIGRFRWSMLFAIAGGCLLVAGASQLLKWLAGSAGAC